jgi:hypothetical protein
LYILAFNQTKIINLHLLKNLKLGKELDIPFQKKLNSPFLMATKNNSGPNENTT